MRANGLDLLKTEIIAIEDVTPAHAKWTETEEDEIGVLQHSSGTTGLQKGVTLRHRAIAAQLDSYMIAIELDRDRDVIVSWLPLYHDMGFVACFLMPLYAGIPIVHLDPFEWLARPGRLFEHIGRWQGTLTWLPNFAFEHLAAIAGRDAANYRLDGMRAFINCSEPCRAISFDRFKRAFAASGVTDAQLQCCYAMAETVFGVTQTKMARAPRRIWCKRRSLEMGAKVELGEKTDDDRELIECGAPVAGITVRVFDEVRASLPEGYVGEIGLSRAFLFSGYNAEPERTRAQIRDGIYFTRDLGFVLDGRVQRSRPHR